MLLQKNTTLAVSTKQHLSLRLGLQNLLLTLCVYIEETKATPQTIFFQLKTIKALISHFLSLTSLVNGQITNDEKCSRTFQCCSKLGRQ